MSTNTLIILALIGGGAYMYYSNKSDAKDGSIISDPPKKAIVDQVPILNELDYVNRARYNLVADSYVPINKFNLLV